MASHSRPRHEEVRARILEIPEEGYRQAFMYQYLIAGRVSEVCGKYAPHSGDCFITDINGTIAVLFAVRTAKRRGRLRPCAVPLDASLEPFAEPVKEWFHLHDPPFKFGPKPKTSVRYMQAIAEKHLRDMEWPMKEYTHPEKGKVPRRWNPFSTHAIRKARTIELRLKFGFDALDFATFCGWTEKSADARMPAAIDHYLYDEIGNAKENMGLLKDLAATYFPKLLNPRI